jgi:demethylmenaquinone methyltransferase / 2-methoxy-6-polyprenyl-1,4-benzoquinol methylase
VIDQPRARDANDQRLAVSKSPDGVRRMFHDIAPHYDFLNRLLSLRIDRGWRRFTARTALRASDKHVLDLCSGTGDLALAFAHQAQALGARPCIVSADFTAAMTRLAQRKFAAQKASADMPLVPLIGDALNVPFGDGAFDAVSVGFGIRNVADLSRGLYEMFRVCRSGGRVAILEFSHPSAPVLRRMYFWYFFRVLPRIGQLISRTPAYSYLSETVSAFPDTEEFVAILRQFGHGPVTAHRLTFGIATLYVAEKA